MTELSPARKDKPVVARKNPLKLNKLQLKTLTLFQELAKDGKYSTASGEDGSIMVSLIPQPHGDHVHVGDAVASKADANGLWNENVWKALQRKGMIQSRFPVAALISPAGLEYETGFADAILHRHSH